MIGSLGVGPVDLFGSSGGAVNSLALVARHPEQVGTLVAHEPPLASVLPDREPLFAACADIYDTYASAGMGPAMAKFIALVQHKGELPTTYAAQPAPDPQRSGCPPRTTAPVTTRCSGRHPDHPAVRARPRRAWQRVDQGRHRCRCGVRGGDGRPRSRGVR